MVIFEEMEMERESEINRIDRIDKIDRSSIDKERERE
jgi:hypothetical protein